MRQSSRDRGSRFYLPELYTSHSELVVAIFCSDYEAKEWCGLEWVALFSLIKQGLGEQVMLMRFDRAEPRGLYGLAGFVELDRRAPEDAAALILERLGLMDSSARSGASYGQPAPEPRSRTTFDGLERHFTVARSDAIDGSDERLVERLRQPNRTDDVISGSSRVFISYSHDSEGHRARVLTLAQRLRTEGVDAWIDQFENPPPEGWPRWMRKQLSQARFVLIVCTEEYRRRFEGDATPGEGQGANWEGYFTELMVFRDNSRNDRYIPIVLEGGRDEHVPLVLQATTLYRLPSDHAALHGRLTARASVSPEPVGTKRPIGPEDPLEDEKLLALKELKKELALADRDTSEVDERILQRRRELRQTDDVGVGSKLNQRFELQHRVGQGGFASVWRAYDHERQMLVAVKALHRQHADDRSRVERFFRGADRMASLSHPHIVRVLEKKGTEAKTHYFVMEFHAGGDLAHRVQERTWSSELTLPTLKRVAEALQCAHEHRLVHRDVKPANILIGKNDEPKLTDFDLVHAANTTGGTRTGALGTVIYAAPEAMTDASRLDERADVYSLGMVGIFLLHGEVLPFDAMRDTLGFLEKLSGPVRLKQILAKATALHAEKRHQSMTELLQELRAVGDERGAGNDGGPPRLPPAQQARAARAIVEAPAREPASRKVERAGGDVIGETYRLSHRISEGRTSNLWIAENTKLGIRVTVEIPSGERWDATDTLRFMRGATLAARVRHRAIAQVHEVSQDEDQNPFVVMDLLEGWTLEEMRLRSGAIDPVLLIQMLLPILEGVHLAHELGVLHCNIKPKHIFLTQTRQGSMQPKLMGFANAKAMADTTPYTTQITLGTPEYMSPEHCRGGSLDARSDVWSLCVTLYECLVGKPPFHGDTVLNLMGSIGVDEPVPITVFQAGDSELWRILKRGLAKNPEERWKTVKQLGEQLAEWLEGHGTYEDISHYSLQAGWLPAEPITPLQPTVGPLDGYLPSNGSLQAPPTLPRLRVPWTYSRAWPWITLATVGLSVAVQLLCNARP